MDNYNYGIIGNCTSAALISSDCSIDWLCLPENAFIVCTINALYLFGREKEARGMLKNILECASYLGLFSEDIEPQSKRLAGNFPQGFSNLAFIQTLLLHEKKYNRTNTIRAKNGI